MRKAFGALFMLLAAVMLAGAGWLIYQNNAVETEAAESAEQALGTLIQEMQTAPAAEADPSPAPDTTPVPAATEEWVGEVPEMPVMEIDGQEYIGYLELPTIGLKLPVMSKWSYPQLRVAPCRYWGSIYDDSMVIMAHNYERHFGKISTLEIGAPVQFVCADGSIYKYVVAKQENLEKQDTVEMVSSEWDLTLFTCTYGGGSRVTVRLERVLAY